MRKLAAEIDNKRFFQEEGFGVWEDEDENQLVPMFLKTSDTMVDHDMEEFEMEDIFEESVIDIYACDDGNRLAVVEYAEDLYANYRRMEDLDDPYEILEENPQFTRAPTPVCVEFRCLWFFFLTFITRKSCVLF
ncbi:hypothetical protein L1987_10855 [Smallanthus sonchifolius]|uniref:Uncharacterized protein n=1 Tax=Smallanthus sonchifolius TaxID=185202 RepID=A0ACB9JBJ9_9ASTR|nr:hypothetical protein L1987_10855 [Smallanthus sonchifolius]